jgi:hypothetical protein
VNVLVAAVATIALSPVVISPKTAYARGGGGGGGGRGGRGGNPVPSGGGGGRGATGGGGTGGPGSKGAPSGGKGGKGGKVTASGKELKPTEYLLQMQMDDSDDHRADFLVDALDNATIEARDKDRASSLAANREAQSRLLRNDDLSRP